jgi:colanic acid/amylovoran biosynthesis protein
VNVLIVNAYSARNRGDGMIVSRMVRLFRDRGCTVRVMSDDPADGDRYGVERVQPLAPLWPSDAERPAKTTIVGRVLRAYLRPRGLEQFRWADVVVSAGGGYIYDDGGRTARLNLARRLLPLRAAREVGVPVVLFSQSIGPFESRLWRSIVGREVRQTRLVIVREELSEAVCREMGIPSQVCDDIAFTLEPSEPPATAPALSGRTVGVTVMSYLPRADAVGHRSYLAALSRGLTLALESRSESVAVISQVSAHPGDDDVAVAKELAGRLRQAGIDSSFVDLGEATDEELSAFYGRLGLVVASRLHSGILALCAGTPVIGLSYLPKTDGILARLGLERWALPAAELDARAFAARLTDALEQRGQLEDQVLARIPAVRDSARRAIDLTLEAAQRR